MISRRGTSFPRPVGLALWGALVGTALLGLVGCTSPQTRLQSGEETDVDRYGVKTIGDVTTVGNAEPTRAAGVGLVVGLEGTGGEPAADAYRINLEDDLNKEHIKDIKKELANPNHALVVVTALVPPGAVARDPIDVEVALPPRSGKATSLRGGYLRACTLFNYDYTKHLSPTYGGSNAALRGDPYVRCEGPVLVGLGDGDEATRVKQRPHLGGGRSLKANPLMLLMNPQYQQARVTSVVADRINAAFRGGPADTPDAATAVAKDQPRRRTAHSRGLQAEPSAFPARGPADPPGGLARPGRRQGRRRPFLPTEAGRRPPRPGPDGDGRPPPGGAGPGEHPGPQSRPRLQSPAGALLLRRVAGLPRLPRRRRGAGPRRRQAADAAVLRPDGPGVAGRVGLPFPAARLADDLGRRRDAIRRLPRLRALDEHDEMVQGELLNDSFWLHRIRSDAPPLVHLSTTQRAEIVLFGEEPTLKPPFSFLAGDFAVTATADDDRCSVSPLPARRRRPSACSVR